MLENQEAARKTLEAIAAFIKDAEHLLHLIKHGHYKVFNQQATRMLQSIQQFTAENVIGDVAARTESIADSLKRIIMHARARSNKTFNKIEFELLPLLKEFYHIYYFFSCVYPDKELMRKYYDHEMAPLGKNKYIDEAVETGIYKYELSIAVLAFNKLKYTKMCVESLLEYVPKDLNYELILINHGSTDGTKEYFESIGPTKQIDILINGGGFGAYTRYFEGKYFLLVSNDIIVTENAIANMLRCMESDEKIAWVVPTTPNVSNLQAVPTEYKTIDEMHAFARKNNEHSDPYRWEQRTRLCDPISLSRASVGFSSYGVPWSYYIHADTNGCYGFMDDKQSLLYRRNGYKIILAKDSYCYHFGSVTLGEETAIQESFYNKGRKAFYDAFGIDPWGHGFCWSPELMALLPCTNEGHVNILGLNCGIGSNPLKIKETIKENAHNLDVTLYSVTDDERYVEDLRGVSDVVVCEPQGNKFYTLFPDVLFDYIVFESGLETYPKPLETLKRLEGRLTAASLLIIQTGNQKLKRIIRNHYPSTTTADNWCVIQTARQRSVTPLTSAKDTLNIEGAKGAAPPSISPMCVTGTTSTDERERHIIENLYKQAVLLQEMGRTNLALKEFELILEITDNNPEVHNDIGILYFQDNNIDKALHHLKTAVKMDPDNTDYKMNIADVYMQTGVMDEAIACYREVLERKPDNIEASLALARLCSDGEA